MECISQNLFVYTGVSKGHEVLPLILRYSGLHYYRGSFANGFLISL